MKITSSTWPRSVTALLVFGTALLVLAISAGGTGAATSPFTAVDLGTLGGSNAIPHALNDSGQIVGESTTAGGHTHAFSWTESGGMVDLGEGRAVDVNERGQVVGNGGPHGAFLWTQAGGMIDLGTLGGTDSGAVAVSDSGRVVGSSRTASGETHAFSWTQAGGMVDLGTLAGSVSSAAEAVNAAGQVVGSSPLASGSDRAFSWTQAGGMVDLGCCYAFDVNEQGQVVGYGGPRGAFLWTEAGGKIDLGSLGGYGGAKAVSNTGQVVGYSTDTSGQIRAFSWTQTGGMVDVGSLTSNIKIAVNDHGQVAGTAQGASVYEQKAFSWTQTGGLVYLTGGVEAFDVNNNGDVIGWTFRVINGQGGSRATLWTAVAKPSAPPTVSAAAGDGRATVSFTAPLSGVPIGQYTATASPGGQSANGTKSPITVAGLANGTTYTFTVVATNEHGSGPASEPSNPVTPLSHERSHPEPPAAAPRSAVPDIGFPDRAPPRPPKPVHGGGTAVTTNVSSGEGLPTSFDTVPAPAPGTTTAIVAPVIARASTAPERLIAGKHVSVSFTVTLGDSGARFTTGKLICDPSVDARMIKHREAFKSGIATLRFTIPRTAKGKVLKIRVAIENGGQTATRTSSFLVG